MSAGAASGNVVFVNVGATGGSGGSTTGGGASGSGASVALVDAANGTGDHLALARADRERRKRR